MHKKTEILSVAGSLFSEYGYHGTSMRNLARSLHMREASLYGHIQSKEEILWEIVNVVADQFLAHARTVPRNISPEEQMVLLINGHFEVIARELAFATVFFHEWKFLDRKLRDQIRLRRDTYEAYFRRVIDEGTQQGIFQVEDTCLATLFVLSALNWIYQWFKLDGSFSLEHFARQYAALIVHTLKRPSLT